MTAKEYIMSLRDLIDKYGDLDCVDEEDEPMAFPEFNDDASPCFVLASKR